jgi:DNA-binding Xre family transcriptional regulator
VKKKVKLTEKLDLLMAEKGINKAELAREADIPYTTITSLYDKGYENVKLSTLKKLAKHFNCSLDYIADDDITERYTITTIAAHHDGEEWTDEELNDIEKFKDFVKTRRENKK